MGRMSLATRSRVISMWRDGFKLSKIHRHLAEEGLAITKPSLCRLISKYKQTGSVADRRRTRPVKKLNDAHYRFIDNAMSQDDELSCPKLHILLKEAFPDLEVSMTTVKRARRELGWVAKKTRYCALISSNNQEKRVEWCKKQQESGDLEFENVVWTDECTVQLESHRRIAFHKKGEPVKYKMKPKHPPKVNIWAGISHRGATKVVIFSGIMTATRYVDILEADLLPFLETHTTQMAIDSSRIMIQSTPVAMHNGGIKRKV